jgi:hypothetical protein
MSLDACHETCFSGLNSVHDLTGDAIRSDQATAFNHDATSNASVDHKSSGFPMMPGRSGYGAGGMMGARGGMMGPGMMGPGMMGPQPGMMGAQPGMMGAQPGMMGARPGMMGAQPGMGVAPPDAMGQSPGMPANPNAPIVFLVPTKGVGGFGGLPKMIQLPSLYSVPDSLLLAMCYFQKPAHQSFTNFM